MRILIFLACLLLAPVGVFGRDSMDQDPFVARLKSPESGERIKAAQEIYGAGIDNNAVYEQLAANIQAELPGLTKKSPELEEVAWSVKALASSGNLTYKPLIDSLAASDIRYLARHAGGAQETLQRAAVNGRPYLSNSGVRLITERQAEDCQYISQNTCETSRSPDKCISSHKAQALEAGANAVMVLFSSSQSGGLTLWGASTTMAASYYLCQ